MWCFLERISVDQPDDFERRSLDGRIIITRALRSVSNQLSARGSCAPSCCDNCVAGAGSTLLKDSSAAFVDPGGTRTGSHGARTCGQGAPC
eukprot:5188973-Amphidinium_carterae.1